MRCRQFTRDPKKIPSFLLARNSGCLAVGNPQRLGVSWLSVRMTQVGQELLDATGRFWSATQSAVWLPRSLVDSLRRITRLASEIYGPSSQRPSPYPIPVVPFAKSASNWK